MKKKIDHEKRRVFTDMIPLVIFFIIYKISNHSNPILPATLWLIFSTIIILAFDYLVTKKISFLPLFSASLLLIFGSLTIFLNNEEFIKLKPTILNLFFAIILLIGYYFQKPLLKYILNSAIKMSDKDWLQFSFRWALFFVFMAFLNEVVRRQFSTDVWVNFKVFGLVFISFVFIVSQGPFLIKKTKEFEEQNGKK